MDGIINLTVFQVALAYIFVLIVLAILKIRGIKREKELVIASLRMTLQLVLAGYILLYIFQNPGPYLTFSYIILMEIFAVLTIFSKFKKRLSKQLKKVIVISLLSATSVCLLYFLFAVIRIAPWYNPQYFIPIAGMLTGNSMTGLTLGTKNLLENMTEKRAYIEEALMLGAEPKAAVKRIINNTFDAAIIPTINSMLGMGIVSLPGMMTGQILSGTLPTTAICYQIAIMLGILGSVALSVIIMLQLGYKTFFNRENQLI